MGDELKRPIYHMVRQDSRTMAKLGNAIGGDFGGWLEREGKTNTKNPGRAVGKAAQYAATWYLGGLAGGAGGAAGSAAGTAANAAAQTGATAAEIAAKTLAEETVKTAAQKALEEAAMKGSEGLLSQGFGNTMEAGLMGANQPLTDAAMYMPKNFADAYQYGPGMSNAPGPGVVAPGQQLGAQMDTALMNRGMSDMAGKFGTPSKFSKFATKQGMQMMAPKQQQQPTAPPQRYQYQEQPAQPMYGQQEIPEELKRLLRARGYPI